MRIVVSRSVFGARPGVSPLEKGIIEGDNPVFHLDSCPMRYALKESGCLGMQPKVGGKYHLKLNNGERPIANKYREGKMKRTLKRELKVREIVKRETLETSILAVDTVLYLFGLGSQCLYCRSTSVWKFVEEKA